MDDAPRPRALEQAVPLAIGNLTNAIDLLGNVYNDVRDALNEFVANAYDEIVLGGIHDGIVQVKLLASAKPPRIVILSSPITAAVSRVRASCGSPGASPTPRSPRPPPLPSRSSGKRASAF